MKCSDRKCGGEIDLSSPLIMEIGTKKDVFIFPCSKCNLMHFTKRNKNLIEIIPVIKEDEKLYFRDGKVIWKNKNLKGNNDMNNNRKMSCLSCNWEGKKSEAEKKKLGNGTVLVCPKCCTILM